MCHLSVNPKFGSCELIFSSTKVFKMCGLTVMELNLTGKKWRYGCLVGDLGRVFKTASFW
jgi:hypothetical protein